jgi:hypothetical protein
MHAGMATDTERGAFGYRHCGDGRPDVRWHRRRGSGTYHALEPPHAGRRRSARSGNADNNRVGSIPILLIPPASARSRKTEPTEQVLPDSPTTDPRQRGCRGRPSQSRNRRIGRGLRRLRGATRGVRGPVAGRNHRNRTLCATKPGPGRAGRCPLAPRHAALGRRVEEPFWTDAVGQGKAQRILPPIRPRAKGRRTSLASRTRGRGVDPKLLFPVRSGVAL